MTVRLLVCSLEDIASVNIKDALVEAGGWTEGAAYQGRPVLRRGDALMATIEGVHLYADDIDKGVEEATGEKIDEVVFLSRHRAASRQPSLTVHPIGNWARADYGGREETLVPPAPELMTSLLRELKAKAEGLPFEVVFEVTHHGPYLGSPTLFIEIGSSEETWGDLRAADAIARSLLDAKVEDHPRAVGIGGGHYAPRYTEVALAKRISFGHMLPGYAMDLQDAEGLRDRIGMALEVSNARLAYIHKKSMKRSEATMVAGLVRDLGAETVDSSDLEDL